MVHRLAAELAGYRFVLVRGLAREARHWHGFERALERRFSECTVECHDLPGNGSRWRERSPIEVAAMADVLRDRVWASDPRPVVLVAVSLGAMVCLEWRSRWPGDPIVAIVAINTSAGGVSRAWERMRVPAMRTTARTIVTRDPVARELAILALTSAEHRKDRALAAKQAGFQRDQPIRRSNVIRQMLAAARFRIERPRTGPPVLLLRSARDRLVDPRCSVALAQVLNATLVTHPSAGHDLTLDDPQWVVEQIHAWLPPNHATSSSRSSHDSSVEA